MSVFSIATRADVRGRGSLATCRERWEHFPTKQLYSAVSEKPQLTLRMSKKHKTMQMDPKQQYSHTLLLRWPLWDTPNRGGPCGKTTHLSKERERHQDHMVEVLIRSWGCSTRLSWPHAHPPVHWGISCATWARSWPGNFSQVWIRFWGPTSERGGQTRLVCFNSPVMSSCDKKKSADVWALRGCFSAPVAVSTPTCLLLVSQDKLGNGERFLAGSRDSEQL